MYSLRSQKVTKMSDNDVTSDQNTSNNGVATEKDAGTTRSEPSTRGIKRRKQEQNSAAKNAGSIRSEPSTRGIKRGKQEQNSAAKNAGTTRSELSTRGIKRGKQEQNSAAKNSKKKEKKTKEGGDMKNIDKSYKRKWDEDMKKSESNDKGSKAKKDNDIKRSKSIDKRKKTKLYGDMKKCESIDKGNKTKKDNDLTKTENIDEGNKTKKTNDMEKSENIDKENKTERGNNMKRSKSIDEGIKTKRGNDMKRSKSIVEGIKTKRGNDMKRSKIIDEGIKTKRGNDMKRSKSIDKGIETKRDSDIKRSKIIDKGIETKRGSDMKRRKSIDKGSGAKEENVKKNQSIDEGNSSKSSKKKEKKTKESGNMKKTQNIDKSYKRKWNKDIKKNGSNDEGGKAKKDNDMIKSENIDKGNRRKENNDVKKIGIVIRRNETERSDDNETKRSDDNETKRSDDDNETKRSDDMKKNLSIDIGNSSKESNEDYITKMPNEILVKIFSTLSMKDLVNVQFVSPELQDAAHDPCLWKDFKVDLNCSDQFILKKMPAIRNIEGCTTNSAIKTILNNVIDLRKLDCIFYPDVLRSQMEQIVKKYKKLESVAVNMCSPSALECLQVLKSSKSLQKLQLGFCRDHKYYNSHGRLCSLRLPKLCGPFLRNDNFPSLVNLEVKSFLQRKQIVNDSAVLSCLAEIIRCKSQQLKYINFLDSLEIDANILEAANQCTKLQELKIQLFSNSFFREYGINRLTRLRKLNVTIVDRYSCRTTLTTRFSEFFKRGSWSYLTSLTFISNRCCFWSLNAMNLDIVDVLKSIIDNMKALKSLHFEYDEAIIGESQLTNIGNLESLESVKLCGFKVSNTGLPYIRNCHNLRRLELRSLSSPLDNRRVAEMLCSMEKLEFFSLERNYSSDISLQSQNEIKIWISSILS